MVVLESEEFLCQGRLEIYWTVLHTGNTRALEDFATALKDIAPGTTITL
jgi:hypothetical protein